MRFMFKRCHGWLHFIIVSFFVLFFFFRDNVRYDYLFGSMFSFTLSNVLLLRFVYTGDKEHS